MCVTFGVPWIDRSPFSRLVRRSLAKSHVAETNADILAGSYPYEEVLQSMIATFAQKARKDGQVPVVMLIQTRDAADVDVLEIAKPILLRDEIPYFATADHFDPRDQSGFISDSHYRPDIDRGFGKAFVALLQTLKEPE